MAFLFRNRPKNHVELVQSTKRLTLQLSEDSKPNPKVRSPHKTAKWYLPRYANASSGGGRVGTRPPADEASTPRHTRYILILPPPLACLPTFLRHVPFAIHVSSLTGVCVEAEVNQELVFQLLSFIIQEDLLYYLANNIHRLPFESRKDAQVIFSTAFRYKPAGASDPQVLHHIIQFRPEIIISLCMGYDRRESAMPCGGVLREALKYDSIAALLLYDEPTEDGKTRDLGDVNPDEPSTGNGVFWKFFGWIDKGAFEVSADAFNTFRVCVATATNLSRRLIVSRRTFSPNTRLWSHSTFRPISKCFSQTTIRSSYSRKVTSPSANRLSYWARSFWTAPTTVS